ncbi:hypothetical protein [Actinacidiphila oryziradicis]|nr:hypothetical protein [Actinacidiphila oryziradicis]
MDNVHRSTFKRHAVNAAPALTAPSPGPHRRALTAARTASAA